VLAGKKGGKKKKKDAAVYLPSSFVVVVYGEDWFVGEVRDKKGEPEAEVSDDYLYISFMTRTPGDLFQWPKRLDLLNVLTEDILFSCQAPTLSGATSSSRNSTFSLTKSEIKKANNLFMLYKAYYPTETLLFLNICVGCVRERLANCFLLECQYVCVNAVWVSRYRYNANVMSSLWDNNFRRRKAMPKYLENLRSYRIPYLSSVFTYHV
jgi:hypothetical protein